MHAGFDFLGCVSTPATCLLGHQNAQIVEVIINETCRHCYSHIVPWLGVLFCFGCPRTVWPQKSYQRGELLGQSCWYRLQKKKKKMLNTDKLSLEIQLLARVTAR